MEGWKDGGMEGWRDVGMEAGMGRRMEERKVAGHRATCLTFFTEEIQKRVRMMPKEALLEVIVDWIAADLSYALPPNFPTPDWPWYLIVSLVNFFAKFWS
jgi:hypothetical protein